jgi:uncharacterized delta-60 repeat protein
MQIRAPGCARHGGDGTMKHTKHCVEPLEPRRLMAGELDPTFAPVELDHAPSGAVEVTPDGKIVVVSAEQRDDRTTLRVDVRRFLAGGSPDPSFGGGDGAVVHAGLAGLMGEVIDVQPTGDGKLLVAGMTFHPVWQRTRFTLVRLNADGSLDASFGGPAHGHGGSAAGVASMHFQDDIHDEERLRAMAVAPDGRIALVGDVRVAVFTADGTLDPTIDDETYRTIPNAPGRFKWSVPLTTMFFDVRYEARSAAFTADGGALVIAAQQVERGFGENGREIAFGLLSTHDLADVNFPLDSPRVRTLSDDDVQRLADGSILVAGPTEAGGGVVVYKLTPDRQLDTTFGDAGSIVIDYPPTVTPAPRIALLADGRFYVLGHMRIGGEADGEVLHLSRHNPDGTPDPGFGGLATVDADRLLSEATSSADDDLVLFTTGDLAESPQPPMLRRVDGDGSRLTRNGTLLISGTSGNDAIHITRRARDGRILVEVKRQRARVSPAARPSHPGVRLRRRRCCHDRPRRPQRVPPRRRRRRHAHRRRRRRLARRRGRQRLAHGRPRQRHARGQRRRRLPPRLRRPRRDPRSRRRGSVDRRRWERSTVRRAGVGGQRLRWTWA